MMKNIEDLVKPRSCQYMQKCAPRKQIQIQIQIQMMIYEKYRRSCQAAFLSIYAKVSSRKHTESQSCGTTPKQWSANTDGAQSQERG